MLDPDGRWAHRQGESGGHAHASSFTGYPLAAAHARQLDGSVRYSHANIAAKHEFARAECGRYLIRADFRAVRKSEPHILELRLTFVLLHRLRFDAETRGRNRG